MKFQAAIQTYSSTLSSSGKECWLYGIDTRALILTTTFYLVCLLTIPLESPDRIIWFAFVPICLAPLAGLNYSSLFLKSLYILPFILLIGIFNPIFDHREAFSIGSISISMGWITFISLIIRGLLAFQALLLLIRLSGFTDICQALHRLGVPKVFTSQLLLLHRFIGVLMLEALSMHRSVASRGYGKNSFPLKTWASFTGTLLLRSYDRSKRIHFAMLSRGFSGFIPTGKPLTWTLKDSIFTLCYCSVILIVYLVDFSKFFAFV